MSIAILDSSGSRWRCSGSSHHSIADILSLPISSGSLRYCSNSSPVVCAPPLLVAFHFWRALIGSGAAEGRTGNPVDDRYVVSQKFRRSAFIVGRHLASHSSKCVHLTQGFKTTAAI